VTYFSQEHAPPPRPLGPEIPAGVRRAITTWFAEHGVDSQEIRLLWFQRAGYGDVTCRGVLARPARSASAPDNSDDGNTLPYDEFGLSANQPNQPQVGSGGTQTRRDAAGLTAPTSAANNNNDNSNDGNTLPYDEFGLSANQPNQPQVGSVGP
jgi:hypothetical protein